LDQFKTKVKYPANLSATRSMLYGIVREHGHGQAEGISQYIQEAMQREPELKHDKSLQGYLLAKDMRSRTKAVAAIPNQKLDAFTLDQLLDGMREVKTEAE